MTHAPFDEQQDPDRTILIPTPGGRRPPQPQAAQPVPPPAAQPVPPAVAHPVPPPAYPSQPQVPPPSPPSASPLRQLRPEQVPAMPSAAAARMAPPPAAAAVPQPIQPAYASPLSALPGSGLNPLIRAANSLLDLVMPLRFSPTPPDIELLRARLIEAVGRFENEARAAGLDTESLAAARYALCTFLDETISSTPWGAGVWSSRSLLVAFHNEAWGGEKFFLILQRLGEQPQRNLQVLELMYLCLALGMEGRYRVIERGHEQLAILRERLLQTIRQQRGTLEPDLSPHWRSQAVPAGSMLRRVPWWVLAAAAGSVLLVLQLTYSWLLNGKSDPVYSQLAALRVAAPARTPAQVLPQGVAPNRMARFLAPEIAAGLVSVAETADRSTVTLRGDGIFASGSAEVAGRFEPLMQRIGDALASQPGKVVVVGHTDDTRPALSARIASNFDLSRARARTVVTLLAQRAGQPERFSAEGRGDTVPLVPNDSAANRARNRRVDIILMAPPQAQ